MENGNGMKWKREELGEQETRGRKVEQENQTLSVSVGEAKLTKRLEKFEQELTILKTSIKALLRNSQLNLLLEECQCRAMANELKRFREYYLKGSRLVEVLHNG